MRPGFLALAGVGALVTLLCHGSARGGTFRWTDDSGVTHYSDQVPPEATNKRRSVISPQGREVGVIEAPKSLEQLRREQQLKQLRTQQERVLAEQREQDLALLRTYRSTDEMFLTLKGKLDTLDGIVRITEANRLRQKELLAEQERAAASQERDGQAITSKQRDVIEAIRRQIAHYDEKIKAIQGEKNALSERFDRDIARFRALQDLRHAAQGDLRSSNLSVSADRNARDEVSAIACTVGRVCDRAWSLAREYIVRNSRGGLIVDTDKILQTPHPTEDTDYGLTVTRQPGRGEQILFLDVRCRPSSIGEALCMGSRVSDVRANFKNYIERGLEAIRGTGEP